eukprot:6668129-Prymnesium_polylepis.1
MGHRNRYAPRIQVYVPVAAGGYGITHHYAAGAAALIDQIDRALTGRPGQPMGCGSRLDAPSRRRSCGSASYRRWPRLTLST